MDNNKFEKDIELQMQGFGLKPSVSVWEQVERRINKGKKRRFFLWWLFPVMIVFGGGISYIYFHESKSLEATNISVSPVKSDKVEKDFEPEPTPETKKTTVAVSKVKKSPGEKIRLNEPSLLRETFSSEVADQQMNIARLTTNEEYTEKDHSTIIPIGDKLKSIDTIIVVQCNDNVVNNTNFTSRDSVNRQLNFNAFYSFHGSGDLSGAFLEFGKERKFGKRYSFYNNIGVSIHSGPVFRGANYSPLQLNSSYPTLQDIIVGIQAAPTFYRYSKRGDIKIGAGLVARYQMGSYEMVGVSFPGSGGPGQFTIYENTPSVFTVGYKLSVGILLFERRKNKLGFEMFFQNDTRGETITGLGLSLQRTYKK